jgi:hypothetical protein
MDHSETAQHRQEIAVRQIGRRGKPAHSPRERSGVQPRRTMTVCRMQQDLSSERSADVIRVRVRHDETTYLPRGASEGCDGGMKARK